MSSENDNSAPKFLSPTNWPAPQAAAEAGDEAGHCQRFFVRHDDDIRALALCEAALEVEGTSYPARSLVATGQARNTTSALFYTDFCSMYSISTCFAPLVLARSGEIFYFLRCFFVAETLITWQLAYICCRCPLTMAARTSACGTAAACRARARSTPRAATS